MEPTWDLLSLSLCPSTVLVHVPVLASSQKEETKKRKGKKRSQQKSTVCVFES